MSNDFCNCGNRKFPDSMFCTTCDPRTLPTLSEYGVSRYETFRKGIEDYIGSIVNMTIFDTFRISWSDNMDLQITMIVGVEDKEYYGQVNLPYRIMRDVRDPKDMIKRDIVTTVRDLFTNIVIKDKS